MTERNVGNKLDLMPSFTCLFSCVSISVPSFVKFSISILVNIKLQWHLATLNAVHFVKIPDGIRCSLE